VRDAERAGDLADEPDRPIRVEAALLAEQLAQVDAVDERHVEEQLTVD
jgi:hypothetical protein